MLNSNLVRIVLICNWSMYLLSTITYGIVGEYPVMTTSGIKSLIIAWIIEKVN